MLPKHLRILIADSNHQLRFTVEKLLNHAGCFGVAVTGSVDELMVLLEFPGRSFDVVLINSQLLERAGASTLKELHSRGNVVLYRNGLYSAHLDEIINAGLHRQFSAAPTLH